MSPDDLQFLARRANEERRRAAASSDPAVAAMHLELAVRYELMIDNGTRAAETRASVSQSYNEVRVSRDAIRRSMDLLSSTAGVVKAS